MDPVWQQATEVEWLKVSVLVDNVTDMLSEPCEALTSADSGCSYSSERTRTVAAVRAGQVRPLVSEQTWRLAG